jgi:hypothetical protein
MQSRLNTVDSSTDLHDRVSCDVSRESVVENTNGSRQLLANQYQGEALRSYRDVYQTVRFALDHPMSWYLHRARRVRVSYGLPVAWSVVGCICGIAFALIHHKMTPSVNLPSKREMSAVFALHDLNELLLVANPSVRGKL